MDINFISRQNIDTIYDIINTAIVKNYNYNLNNEDKYKKIIKKYTKTIYNSLNKSIRGFMTWSIGWDWNQGPSNTYKFGKDISSILGL